jgi:type II secretory ATPase GspE/PulE/Tfp pilus assembly ATPase PilB-like protein
MGYNQIRLLRSISDLKAGLIIIAGKTGSGKTTTLNGLKTFLQYPKGQIGQKQNTDIILVETTQENLRSTVLASSTKLVIATINSSDIVTTIERLIEMNLESFLTNNPLLIIGQRQKICQKCKQSVPMDDSIVRIISKQAFSEFINSTKNDILELDASLDDKLSEIWSTYADNSLKTYQIGTGCVDCNYTGYNGDKRIFEFLTMDDELAKLISSKAAKSEITAYIIKKKISIRKDYID